MSYARYEVERLGKKLLELQNENGYIIVDILLMDGTIVRGVRVELVNQKENKFSFSNFFKSIKKADTEVVINDNYIELLNLKLNGETLPPMRVLHQSLTESAYFTVAHTYITKISDGDTVIYDNPITEVLERESKKRLVEDMFKESKYLISETSEKYNKSKISQINFAAKIATRMIMTLRLSKALKEHASTNLTILIKYMENGKECTKKTVYTGPYANNIDIGLGLNAFAEYNLENLTGIYTENGDLLMANPMEMANAIYNEFILLGKDPEDTIEEAKAIVIDEMKTYTLR